MPIRTEHLALTAEEGNAIREQNRNRGREISALGALTTSASRHVESIGTIEHGLSAEEIKKGVAEGTIQIRAFGIDILE
ncbi:hypothetical protein BVY00_01795 [bacterium G20]|nr:hypothetical protein BVY00_01795 [bacterium G20]